MSMAMKGGVDGAWRLEKPVLGETLVTGASLRQETHTGLAGYVRPRQKVTKVGILTFFFHYFVFEGNQSTKI